jgi:Suppressor of fused protein (SUFU)/Ankyrin repeats (3 copies)
MQDQMLIRLIATAILLGDVNETRRLLTQNPQFVRGTHSHESWVSTAVPRQNVELMKLLLDLGCDVNADEDYQSQMTALGSALQKDNLEIIKMLLEHGANPNRHREVISAIVSKKHSLEKVKLLDQYGADFHREFMNELAKEPMNALSTAIDSGKTDVADYLRAKGCVLPGAGPPKSGPPTLDDEIVAYFAEQFGPVQPAALIEIVPTEPAIAVHVIPASPERNHVTLFSTGMSAKAMKVPPGGEDFQFAELFVQLPADWPYTRIEDAGHGWPIHWLRSTAKYPHQHDTWLGGPVTIMSNDDPPQPLAPNTKFTSLLFLAEKSFVSREGRTIRFYRMVPLYTSERDLEIREGADALMRALDDHNVGMVVDLKRLSVA